MTRVQAFSRLLLGSVCLVAAFILAPKAWNGVYQRLERDSLVEIKPEWGVGEGRPCSPQFPILVTTTNHSRYTVTYVNFQLYVHAPRRSTDKDGDNWYPSDAIIPPGESSLMCWSASQVPDMGPDWSYELDVHGPRVYDAPSSPTIKFR